MLGVVRGAQPKLPESLVLPCVYSSVYKAAETAGKLRISDSRDTAGMNTDVVTLPRTTGQGDVRIFYPSASALTASNNFNKRLS